MSYWLENIDGLARGRKGVVFLRSDDDKSVNAKELFDKAVSPCRKKLMHAFTHWIGGHHDSKIHHGWDHSQKGGKYVHCYNFKDRGHKVRLYGYLCNPKPNDRGFEGCVLVRCVHKAGEHTDFAELDRVLALRNTFTIWSPAILGRV